VRDNSESLTKLYAQLAQARLNNDQKTAKLIEKVIKRIEGDKKQLKSNETNRKATGK
jgi:hypothetical protein